MAERGDKRLPRYDDGQFRGRIRGGSFRLPAACGRVFPSTAILILLRNGHGECRRGQSLLVRYRNDVQRAPFYRLAPFLRERTPVYYFHSLFSPLTGGRGELLGNHQGVHVIPFRSSRHGIPFLKCCLNRIFQSSDEKLLALCGTEHHPVRFSLRCAGVWGNGCRIFQTGVAALQEKALNHEWHETETDGFHQYLAPYRIDFFNALARRGDMEAFFEYEDSPDHHYNRREMESRCVFRPRYLNHVPVAGRRIPSDLRAF